MRRIQHPRGGIAFLLSLVLLACALLATSCSEPQQPMLDVTPLSAALVTGQTVQLNVTRRFPNGPVDLVTDRVGYGSSNRNVATISDRGVVTAGAEAGSVIVRIQDPLSDAVATVSFTVSVARVESIEVVPSPAIVMQPGTSRRFVATAHYNNGLTKDVTEQALWASSNEAVATVATVGRPPGEVGTVSALIQGDTTITATDSQTFVQGRSIVFVRHDAAQLKAIVVTPNPATIPVGGTVQFGAQGIYSDGTTRDLTALVGWKSSPQAVATIGAGGLAVGVLAGAATISASAAAVAPGDAGVGAVVTGSAAATIP